MELVGITRDGLADYIARQLDHVFPDRQGDAAGGVRRTLGETLGRLNRCINAVRMWPENRFHYLHSEQNTIFLAYLANTVWRNGGDPNLATKLFYLNKSLNGFHCFYDTELPERFFVGHSVGIVLVRLKYPEYFAIYQGCTVGKNHGAAPTLADGLVMYPGSAIIGDCRTGPRTYLAQGCSLVDSDSPGDCLVFNADRRPVFKKPGRDILADLFRL
jgi:serine O-acetyltransferase